MYQGTLEPISNRADWFGTIELVNDDTGEVVTDLTGVSVRLELRDCICRRASLTASTDAGTISIVGSVIEWRFTPAQLSGICPGSYEMGVVVTRDGITDQELIAILPIIDGIVR